MLGREVRERGAASWGDAMSHDSPRARSKGPSRMAAAPRRSLRARRGRGRGGSGRGRHVGRGWRRRCRRALEDRRQSQCLRVRATQLAAVSCPGPAECVAVGTRRQPTSDLDRVVERVGLVHRAQPLPSPTSNMLDGVSCSGPTDCTAVGAHGGGHRPADADRVVERDGLVDRAQPLPLPDREHPVRRVLLPT